MTHAAARAVTLCLLAALALPAAARGQQIVGVALDEQGRPLPGVIVALHRVGGGGGGTAASTTTDAAGAFHFAIEEADSAVYFAAMRYNERMYIGPAVRVGVEQTGRYVLQADPAAEAGTVASALSGGATGGMATRPPPPAPATTPSGGGADAALWILALLGIAAAGAFLVTAPAYRRQRTRHALVELATIENRLAEGPPGEEDEELRRRRDGLRARLAPRP